MDPTLTFSIDRTGMAGVAGPLVFSGADDDALLGLSSWRDVAMRPSISYSPGSRRRPGTPTAWTWMEGLLAYEFITDRATNEGEAQDAYDEVVAALARLKYTGTAIKNGGTPQVWRCRPGSVEPADPLNYPDLRDFEYAYSVSIPVHPVRS